MNAQFRLTVRSGVTRSTSTSIVSFVILRTGSAMLAGMCLARRSGIDLAVLTLKSSGAVALVSIGPGNASPMLHARIMGTVVRWNSS